MSDEQTPPRRRRIAGESAAPAKKAAAAKPVAKKPVAKKLGDRRSAKPQVEPSPPPSEARARARKPAAAPAEAPSVPRRTSAPKPETTTSGGGTSGGGPGRRDAVTAVAAVLAVVLGVGVLGWGLLSRSTTSYEDSRDEARSTAVEAAEAILSYDYENLDQQHDEATSFMTDAYATEYRENTQPSLDELAPQRQVSVEAVVRNAGVVPCGSSCDVDATSVLLYVDLDRRTEQGETADIFGNRLVVQMVRDDGGTWLVDDVQGI